MRRVRYGRAPWNLQTELVERNFCDLAIDDSIDEQVYDDTPSIFISILGASSLTDIRARQAAQRQRAKGR
jgi:hypothetical protein